MIWIGFTVGTATGFAVASLVGHVFARMIAYLRLERELAADLRAVATEERAAAALRAIAENTRQANRESK